MTKSSSKRNYINHFIAAFIIMAALLGGAALLISHYYPVRHLDIINEYAEQYGLDPALVCAVIHAESRFKENAVSVEGASGLMQIMEETAYWIAPQAGIEDFDYVQIFDPAVNIRLGTFYLSMQKNRFGERDVALSAYNAGSGNVIKWLSNPEYSSDGRTLDAIPFSETRNYVRRVASSEKIYAILLRISGS